MFRTLVLFALGLTGCASGWVEACESDAPHECEALQFIWGQKMHVADRAPPRVEWDFDICPGTDKRAHIVDGKCYYGSFYFEEWKMILGYMSPISKSAFSHELMHAMLHLRYKDGDPNHRMIEYWHLVDEWNKDLAARGL